MGEKRLSINLNGYLMDLNIPKVMGILNITPDSFYSDSRKISENDIHGRVIQMVEEGADIIDIGGCSTRPGFTEPSLSEEWERIDLGCRIVRKIAPHLPISIDTFRAAVAVNAIERWNVEIVNDISGGKEKEIWDLAADKKIVYVLTHNRENGIRPYSDITADVIKELSYKVNELHRKGVNDVIIDPGFGFAKTTEQNFRLFDELNEVVNMGYPVLVGISRKSMIYKTLNCNPEDALTGTIALDAIALEKGADILRVHDVKEAKETVELYSKLKNINV